MSRELRRTEMSDKLTGVRTTVRSQARAALIHRTRSHHSVALVISAIERIERMERRLLPKTLQRWLARRLGLEGRTISSMISSPDGHIDEWITGVLSGWAWIPVRPEHHVTIVVTAGGVPVSTAIADQYRADVRAAGYGDGRYGFRIPVSSDVVTEVAGPELDHLDVHALSLNGIPVLIGDVPLITRGRLSTLLDRLPADFIARHITPLAASGVGMTDQGADAVAQNTSSGDPSPAYRRLFHNDATSPQVQTGDRFQARPVASPYMRYSAQRFRADLPIERSAQSVDALLRWYLDIYGNLRGTARPPLSPSEIAYLNAPVNTITAAPARPLSRVSLSYYLEDDPSESLSPMSIKGYRDFAYWWCAEKAPSLNVEDCLVPDYFMDVLRAPATFEPIAGVPVSTFLEIYVSRHEGMKGVNLRTLDGALGVYLHLILRAAQRPDLLYYIPDQVIDLFLGVDESGVCQLDDLVRIARDRFAVQFGQAPRAHASERSPQADLLACLNGAGYDLARRRFRSVDADGYRVYAAQLPRPTSPSITDVQVIGPFAKASGLGQACRLAGDIIQATRYTSNLVDFGLDNPAKEGFSTSAGVGGIGNARVNLLQLNAESVPLAFAYLPDVFTDSYNIGFFYWELDSPAACHGLALELLDEVWVASEYGVSQYRPFSHIPVTNVGMAFEAAPHIDRAEARATLGKRFGVRDGTFVFVATFDSYSYPRRKNPVGTIRAFQAAFGSRTDDVMLILKTQNRRKVVDSVQALEMNTIYEMAASDQRVRIVDETLDYTALLELKTGCDAYVSLHRSEGWGFGPIEAMALGVPVICTAYSGNMEYCNEDTAWLVDYELVNVPEGDYIFVLPGQRWAEPSLSDAAAKMRECFENKTLRHARAEAARKYVDAKFSTQAVSRRWEERLDAILASRGETQINHGVG